MSHGNPIRISIYGSCVSRDTVETWDPDSYRLQRYIARQSLISAYSPGPQLMGETIDTRLLASDFQRRMLSGDWCRSLRVEIENAASDTDLLLIDLIDERLGVYELGAGQYITNSLELMQSSTLPDLDNVYRLIAFGSDEHFSLWSQACEVFVRELGRYGLLERALVLKAPWAKTSVHGEQSSASFGVSADHANQLFLRYYDFAAARINMAAAQDDQCLSDPGHKWGAAPFHYTGEFYAVLTEAIHTHRRTERKNEYSEWGHNSAATRNLREG